MTQFGSQIQTAVHVRLATAAALDTCTYSDTTAQIPANQDLGAKLVATVAGALTVDSVAAAVDDEILVKDQSSTLQNGVYRVRSAGSTTTVWSLERSRQARDSGQFDGMLVTTGPEGSSNPSALFIYSGADNPVIGTDAIVFAAQTGADLSLYAKLANPHFTGVPTAPTAALGTDTTQIATTDFVLANTGTVSPSPSAPSTGATETYAVNGPITTGIVDPSGTLAALTVVLGDGTLGGQTFWLVCTQIITALTLTGTFNGEGLADPTALVAGSTTVWQWDAADAGGTLGWARIL